MNKIRFAGVRPGENSLETEEIDKIIDEVATGGGVVNSPQISIPTDWLITKPEAEKTKAEKAFDEMLNSHLTAEDLLK